MKTAVFLSILGTILPMIFYGQRIEKDNFEKVYITPSQVFWDDSGIFVYVKEQWLPVREIHCDHHGTCVAVIRTRWICPACFYNNSEYANTCQRVYPETGEKCGYPRPQKKTS